MEMKLVKVMVCMALVLPQVAAQNVTAADDFKEEATTQPPTTKKPLLTVEDNGNQITATLEADEAVDAVPREGECDFGQTGKLTWCSWIVGNGTGFNWKLGSGMTHLITGGPPKDATTLTDKGGYTYLELSEKSALEGKTDAEFDSGILGSTILHPEGVERCVSFSYIVSNSGSFEVMLKDVDTKQEKVFWKGGTPNEDSKWATGCFIYAHDDKHQITFIGRHTKPKLTRHRPGCHYLAIDNLKISNANSDACKGHCAFTKDFCMWENDNKNDDFDWQLERSSKYADSGPSSDYSNFGKFVQIGAYAYISSEFPRKPNEIARLISPEFKVSESPLCMKFKSNLYGANDGQLRVLIMNGENIATEKWIIRNGYDKQRWINSQVLLSSSKNFKVILEGKVSSVGRGVIAVDDLSFQPGTCAVLPKVEVSQANGVCDFEDSSLCGWRIESSAAGIGSMHKWERKSPGIDGTSDNDFYNVNVTGYYMAVAGSGYSSSSLISPRIKVSEMPCISFMYIIWKRFSEQSGPMIGTLKVFLLMGEGANSTRTLLWKARGHQDERWMKSRAPIVTSDKQPPKEPYRIEIVEESDFPGPNGLQTESAVIAVDDVFIYDGICDIYPSMAVSIPGECEFQSDLCGWTEHTTMADNAKTGEDLGTKYPWKVARLGSSSVIEDHTYKRASGGYAYFYIDKHGESEIKQHSSLNSPIIPKSTARDICLTFWYRGTIPSAVNISLNVNLLTLNDDLTIDDGKTKLLWREVSITKSIWSYGRVPLNLTPNTLHKFQFEGIATDAGYCIDDVIILQGSCTYVPIEAKEAVKVKT